jgi:hypothetical protein
LDVDGLISFVAAWLQSRVLLPIISKQIETLAHSPIVVATGQICDEILKAIDLSKLDLHVCPTVDVNYHSLE